MEQKAQGPMWVAVLSGAVVLGAGPLALAVLLLITRGRDDGAFSGLAELIAEGGAFSYGVLLAGAVASLIGAVVVLLSVRRPAVPGALAVTPFLLASLVAFIGTSSGMAAAREAVAFAAPADRATIIAGATGELFSLAVQGLALAAAGCFAVAVAALLSLLAPSRGPRLVTAFGAGGLGLSLAAGALRIAELSSGFRAVAHASPADRLTILVAVVREAEPLATTSTALLLASLLGAIIIAAIVARAPEARTAAIGAAAALVVSAVGFRGLAALLERSLRNDDVPASGPSLLVVQGLSPDSDAVALSAGTVDFGQPRPSRWDVAWVGVQLEPGLAREPLVAALRRAHARHVGVELVGNANATPAAELPPLLQALGRELSRVQLAVPVLVLFDGEVCEHCTAAATLTKAGLEVKHGTGDASTWATLDRPTVSSYDSPKVIDFGWAGSPEDLARAGQLALANGHVLAVRVSPE